MKKNANKQMIDQAMINKIIQKEMQTMDLGGLSASIGDELNQYFLKSIFDESLWQKDQ